MGVEGPGRQGSGKTGGHGRHRVQGVRRERGTGDKGGSGERGFYVSRCNMAFRGLNKPKIAYTCNLNYHGLSWTEKFSVVGGWVVSK